LHQPLADGPHFHQNIAQPALAVIALQHQGLRQLIRGNER